MRSEPGSFEYHQALMARAHRARAEAMAAIAGAVAKTVWTQVLKLQRPWLARTRAEPHH